MDSFGMTGFTFGLMGFVFGVVALRRVDKLEKKLKELEVIDKDFKSQ
ncbi:hypothetical protein [Aliiglaciecola lipolytica]|uniref:Uncharacterized protein n=1 Tax=Aliiglaciecola lipolytica E3 TaxID=1127673 RepID=K6Y8D1_9ALTE|nr:hypothetical protein [Aliiglaciecola lipolytica]GAC12893.1 hypothetical protein GLIP_0239 [Aliiglaciecola lipolytica E3]